MTGIFLSTASLRARLMASSSRFAWVRSAAVNQLLHCRRSHSDRHRQYRQRDHQLDQRQATAFDLLDIPSTALLLRNKLGAGSCSPVTGSRWLKMNERD